ncbi:carbohydrate kinase, PfkB family [Anopheles sinensis]|uniref:Carbohydrate kinase, PfkB family n=1 Tax=Anopheles sinensis TaxID=74873 RepID=A0A084VBN2_ANOSI|nr:carbohydrate kinase, PfkB family [Anopheles sinensis]
MVTDDRFAMVTFTTAKQSADGRRTCARSVFQSIDGCQTHWDRKQDQRESARDR